jgi:hypothetical protein
MGCARRYASKRKKPKGANAAELWLNSRSAEVLRATRQSLGEKACSTGNNSMEGLGT